MYFRSSPISAIVLVFISTIVLLSCGAEPEAPRAIPRIPVHTTVVPLRQVQHTVLASGSVSARREMLLSFRVGGIIQHIGVKEGDAVKEGGLLARLDQTEIRARAAQAQAAYEKARRDLGNAEKLYADSAVALDRVQDAGTLLESAEADLAIARHNLAFSQIRAPTDGRILQKRGEASEMIGPGQPLFLFLSTTGAPVLRAGVTDRDIAHLGLGDSSAVRLAAYPSNILSATVTELAAGAHPQTGLYEIELSFSQPDLNVLPGMIGSARIFTQTVRCLPAIPVESLIDADEDRGYAYVLRDSVAAKRLISLGEIINPEVLVTSGISAGETVITTGAAFLKDGQRVEIIPPDNSGLEASSQTN